MKKLLIGFFLLMWGFFLNGQGRVEAHAVRALSQHASTDLPQPSAPAGLHLDEPDDLLLMIHRPSSSDKAFIKIDATEVREETEDEDGHSFNSLRRQSASSHYTHSDLLAQLLGYAFSSNKKITPFCKYFSYTSSDRYLAFLVFRI